MDHASALIDRLVRSARHHGTWVIACAVAPARLPWVVLLVVAAGLVVGLTLGDLLAPAPDPILAAPFRWKALSVR